MPTHNSCDAIHQATSATMALMEASFLVDSAELVDIKHDFEVADDEHHLVCVWVIVCKDPKQSIPLVDISGLFPGFEKCPEGSLWLNCMSDFDYTVHVLHGEGWRTSNTESTTYHPVLNRYSLDQRVVEGDERSLMLGWATVGSTCEWKLSSSDPWKVLASLEEGKSTQLKLWCNADNA
jgi:hypothetical protein